MGEIFIPDTKDLVGQPPPFTRISERPLLMVEQAQAAKGHGNTVFVAGVNHLLVADGTASFRQ
jgi:hypothetical protein